MQTEAATHFAFSYAARLPQLWLPYDSQRQTIRKTKRQSALCRRLNDGADIGVKAEELQQHRVQRVLRDQEIMDREIMNAGREKTFHRVPRRFDDRLALHVE